MRHSHHWVWNAATRRFLCIDLDLPRGRRRLGCGRLRCAHVDVHITGFRRCPVAEIAGAGWCRNHQRHEDGRRAHPWQGPCPVCRLVVALTRGRTSRHSKPNLDGRSPACSGGFVIRELRTARATESP